MLLATGIPFAPTGKATRRIPDDRLNPDGRLLRRFERQLTGIVLEALQQQQTALFNGIDDSSILMVTMRLDQESIVIPFRDAVVRGLQRIAIAGAEFGREQVERQVFGVKAFAGKAAGDPLNIDWQLANNAVAEWARKYGYDLVSGINATTRQRLRQEISQFVQNDEALPELITRLEDVFGPVRAELIGVTEVTRSFAEGNRQAWKEAGIIQKQEWRTANDELRCPICSGLDGQIVGLDEKFTGGIDSPPAHPRCRCWLSPVTEFIEDEAGLV
jgi:SPP1 gp7 family putative phage head morphogenesis protein